MITILRIDERLIHGQVAHAWSKAYPSDGILVIDNEVSKDNFQIQLLQMATPKGMKCFVKNVNESKQFLNKFESKKLLVVVKSVTTVLAMVECGIDVKSVNVGGLYHASNRWQVSNTVYIDQDIKSELLKLLELNVNLEIRATPSDSKQQINVSTLEAK